ncbi:hypothetical protein Tco_0154813 [Tanacetum coccineum]
MSHKETKEEKYETDSEIEVRPTEQIKEQKRIEESVKANMAKKEVDVGKEELVDILGIDVVTNMYKAKIKYDKHYDKMLNSKEQLRITNCDVLTRKGPITLKVYMEDSSDKVIPNFKSTKRHKSSVQYGYHPVRTVLNEPILGMILFNSFQRQDFISIKDCGDFTNEMTYTVQDIFLRLHQGPGLDDHA